MATQFIEGILKIHYKGRKITERYCPLSNDLNAAAAILKRICLYRTSMLAFGPSIEYARVSWVDVNSSDRDGVMAITDPISRYDTMPNVDLQGSRLPAGKTPDSDNFVNDPNVGLFYRFSADNSRWANRCFRCVPDAWVNDTLLQAPPAGIPTKVPPLAAPILAEDRQNQSQEGFARSFFTYLLTATRLVYIASFAGDGKTPADYGFATWNSINFRAVSGRRAGTGSKKSKT